MSLSQSALILCLLSWSNSLQKWFSWCWQCNGSSRNHGKWTAVAIMYRYMCMAYCILHYILH